MQGVLEWWSVGLYKTSIKSGKKNNLKKCVHVVTYRFSFFPATISSWNNLPFGIEKVDSVEGLKLKLKEHTIRSP